VIIGESKPITLIDPNGYAGGLGKSPVCSMLRVEDAFQVGHFGTRSFDTLKRFSAFPDRPNLRHEVKYVLSLAPPGLTC